MVVIVVLIMTVVMIVMRVVIYRANPWIVVRMGHAE